MLKKTLAEFKKIAAAWSESNAGTYGAAAAYYAIFSIAPLTLIVIAAASLVLDIVSMEADIIAQLNSALGQKSGNFIEFLIQARSLTSDTNIFITVIGFVILFIGSIAVFSQLQIALDVIFRLLPDKTLKKDFWFNIKQKLFSFGLVLLIGFLLMGSLIVSILITSFESFLSGYILGGEVVAHMIEVVVSFILVSFFLGLMYKVLPSKIIAWKSAFLGGLITGIFFILSKFLLGIYLSSSDVLTGYGGASALVLLILWIYYLSQVFLFGAIMIRLYIAGRK